jgi:demethylmenaquinone methyltransferase / 2-methoxy-6-polyprenyl-1,4-benzoquinol methylase
MSEDVRRMFANIAGKYDLLNDVLSLGIHHSWRRKAVRESGCQDGMQVLDCACGTGDLSFAFKKKVGPGGEVTGTDFCEPMLVIARDKTKERNIDIKFEFADAMNLQYEDEQFDISSISFGIRNVDDPRQGLQEMARVLRPGGKVVVIEFGQPRGIFSLIYKIYSKTIIPLIGKILSKSDFAYDYLPQTAAAFPCREEFTKIMESTGLLKNCRYHTLSFGIAFLYVGERK